MCGRFTFTKLQPAIVSEADGIEVGQDFAASYNLAPGQRIPVLRKSQDGGLRAVNPHWGLVPTWVKDGVGLKPQINARVETAAVKPSFRDAWKNRRCLVLADGYFEWPVTSGGQSVVGREPFYVSLPDRRPFLMAGLWSLPRALDGESIVRVEERASCAILTTRAKEEICWLHERMPFILDTGQAIAWLDGGDPSLVTVPLTTTQVSPYVNNVAHQGPRCIEKVSGLFD